MNSILSDFTAEDLIDTQRQYKCSLDTAKAVLMTDAMFSALVKAEMHLNNDELKEAITIQNNLLMALITETRPLS